MEIFYVVRNLSDGRFLCPISARHKTFTNNKFVFAHETNMLFVAQFESKESATRTIEELSCSGNDEYVSVQEVIKRT